MLMIFCSLKVSTWFLQIIIAFLEIKKSGPAQGMNTLSNGPESCDVSEEEKDEEDKLTKNDLVGEEMTKGENSNLKVRSSSSTPERGFSFCQTSRPLPATLIMKKPRAVLKNQKQPLQEESPNIDESFSNDTQEKIEDDQVNKI